MRMLLLRQSGQTLVPLIIGLAIAVVLSLGVNSLFNSYLQTKGLVEGKAQLSLAGTEISMNFLNSKSCGNSFWSDGAAIKKIPPNSTSVELTELNNGSKILKKNDKLQGGVEIKSIFLKFRTALTTSTTTKINYRAYIEVGSELNSKKRPTWTSPLFAISTDQYGENIVCGPGDSSKSTLVCGDITDPNSICNKTLSTTKMFKTNTFQLKGIDPKTMPARPDLYYLESCTFILRSWKNSKQDCPREVDDTATRKGAYAVQMQSQLEISCNAFCRKQEGFNSGTYTSYGAEVDQTGARLPASTGRASTETVDRWVEIFCLCHTGKST